MIRAADNPVRPDIQARPASPGHPATSGPAGDAPDDVYVYRDTSEATSEATSQAPVSAAPEQAADERDTSYWYDLPGTGTGTGTGPVLAETRGPFEPLVSSSRPPPVPPASVPGPASAPDSPAARVPPNARGDAEPQDPARGRTSKLEQINEFGPTAEAVGDQHFDQLLAQQRDLISEYFERSPAAQAGADHDRARTPGQPGFRADSGLPAGPGQPGSAGGQTDAAHRDGIVAEPPRVW